MATVVAAIDIARVRQPVHVEVTETEEEDAERVEAELGQRATAMVVSQQNGASWTRGQAGHVLTTAQVTPESTLLLPQVSEASTARLLNYEANCPLLIDWSY